MDFKKCFFSGVLFQGIGLSLFAQTTKPNIVVIIADQQRADLCGREGFPLNITPFVDELAHQNAWFDKAYTVMPASAPARCSLFTGRFPNATHAVSTANPEGRVLMLDQVRWKSNWPLVESSSPSLESKKPVFK